MTRLTFQEILDAVHSPSTASAWDDHEQKTIVRYANTKRATVNGLLAKMMLDPNEWSKELKEEIKAKLFKRAE